MSAGADSTLNVAVPRPERDLEALPRWIDKVSKRAVVAALVGLRAGRLRIREGGESFEFGTGSFPPLEIVIKRPRFWTRVALGGGVGAGEAWRDGDWTTEDLTSVLRLFARQPAVSDRLGSFLAQFLERVAFFFRRNTREGSRRNIHEHYDLGNSFFQLWLDPTLSYSSAIFTEKAQTLELASLNKLEVCCRKLRLQAGEHLLEIGSGWGALAIHAAKNFGCRVTTTTISEEQFRFVSDRVAREGLERQITVLKSDYRDLDGKFDKVVSIEMIEAVGHHFYETYFSKLQSLLLPHGAALIQAIVINDQRYSRALKHVDFIQKHIFPGSCIPSVSALLSAATRSEDLSLCQLEEFNDHYAATLRAWRASFLAKRSQIEALGLSPAIIPLWEYYFAYCEAGFLERHLRSVHLLFSRPGFTSDSARLP